MRRPTEEPLVEKVLRKEKVPHVHCRKHSVETRVLSLE